MARIIGDPDELITTIRHLAKSDVQRIEQQAEEEAEEIHDEARQRAERRREEILDEARNRARDIRRSRKAEVSRDERREYLEAREEILGTVWHQAEQKLRSLMEKDDEYASILESLTLSAVTLMGAGQRVLAADEKGLHLLTDSRLENWSREAGKALGEKVTFKRASEPLQTWGGLVMTEQEGRRRVDATFAQRLETARTEVRSAVLAKLVGGNG